MRSSPKRTNLLLIAILFIFTGCTSTIKTSPTYQQTISNIKTIAVMPPDVEVYKISAGGVRELMDEWSDETKKFIREALEKHLGKRHNVEVKFVEEDWLKENHKEAWKDNLLLYNMISVSAYRHAYPGADTFKTKARNFDYTLGTEIQKLSAVTETDTMLFIYGYDHEATAGRKILAIWNMMLFGASGLSMTPNPSFMAMGLVNSQTGNLEWFNLSPAQVEYSFRSQKHINALIEWLSRHLIKKEKKR